MTEENINQETPENPDFIGHDNGLKVVGIDEQMRSAYLDYAMSVIVARAIPDVRDGLKPVHRRILYAMNDMGIRANTPYKKSARIVGEFWVNITARRCGGLRRDGAHGAGFSMRYMLVQGQATSVPSMVTPGAMRYTEARLAKISDELWRIWKETVDFVDNFDGSLKEPEVLPRACQPC